MAPVLAVQESIPGAHPGRMRRRSLVFAEVRKQRTRCRYRSPTFAEIRRIRIRNAEASGSNPLLVTGTAAIIAIGGVLLPSLEGGHYH